MTKYISKSDKVKMIRKAYAIKIRESLKDDSRGYTIEGIREREKYTQGLASERDEFVKALIDSMDPDEYKEYQDSLEEGDITADTVLENQYDIESK
jgi:hypothetical protein